MTRENLWRLSVFIMIAHRALFLTVTVLRRPVSNPVGAMVAGGDAKGASKAATTAWAELVRGLRRRGPAAKGDASLSAALSRLTDAQGDRPAALPSSALTILLYPHTQCPQHAITLLGCPSHSGLSPATHIPAGTCCGSSAAQHARRAPTRWHRGAALLSCTGSTAIQFLMRCCRRAAVARGAGGTDCALGFAVHALQARRAHRPWRRMVVIVGLHALQARRCRTRRWRRRRPR